MGEEIILPSYLFLLMVYLDNNATTFLDPQVRETLVKLLNKNLGNGSSIHRLGQTSKAMLAKAAVQVAKNLGVLPEEIFFTSGATEGLNMLVQGLCSGAHVIASALEHSATLAALERRGNYTLVPPKKGKGSLEVEDIEPYLQENTRLLIVMSANNETGIVTDLDSIAQWAFKKGICLLTDMVGSFGKEPFFLPKGVTAAVFSGHKIHGPQGTGFVFLRKGIKCLPLIVGGAQMGGRRAGTENVIGVSALAHAVELLCEKEEETSEKMAKKRDLFEALLQKALPQITIIGKDQKRVSSVSTIAFEGLDGELLLMRLDLRNLYCSMGSACASGGIEPSHVLNNMKLPFPFLTSTLRFSFSRFTTEEEIQLATAIIVEEVGQFFSPSQNAPSLPLLDKAPSNASV